MAASISDDVDNPILKEVKEMWMQRMAERHEEPHKAPGNRTLLEKHTEFYGNSINIDPTPLNLANKSGELILENSRYVATKGDTIPKKMNPSPRRFSFPSTLPQQGLETVNEKPDETEIKKERTRNRNTKLDQLLGNPKIIDPTSVNPSYKLSASDLGNAGSSDVVTKGDQVLEWNKTSSGSFDVTVVTEAEASIQNVMNMVKNDLRIERGSDLWLFTTYFFLKTENRVMFVTCNVGASIEEQVAWLKFMQKAYR